jgi:hypothetical protein
MKRKEQRRLEGEVRNDAWRALTTKDKLADLDRRLGIEKGAARQRKLLEGAK